MNSKTRTLQASGSSGKRYHLPKASFYQCAVVQDIMSLMLHGSESDVKSALEKYSASKLAITAVTTLKQSVDKLSQEEKNGYKTLVEKVLEKC
ncbi:uncharacterized protein LOC128417588 isoform X1 [Podarcis raffonei]|uniref:uncharacterized protein LOC128417588 isoform X1 n=1 Tax=Podarcis raffonei TaxID=65483 RepID=UPI00232964A6|nr:uncharacterized protein LOC128417588 isoform X1 [Podarcis raffonei]